MTPWDIFFKEKCIDIFITSKEVIDIGGGLRLDVGRGNRVEKKNKWILPYLKNVDYKIVDPVPDYHPDIIGDINNLPFENGSREAIFCLAVLEHVQNPLKAIEELYRVLKPGGKLLLYVPFLYYYHAEKGYYGDYWRFTYDTMNMFAEPFSHHEIQEVRLPLETLVRLTPLGRYMFPLWLARHFDKLLYKKGSRQVAGYYLFARK